MIKTFRGLLTDGAQDTIVVHTNDGATGYRIVKFEVFPSNPGTAEYEGVVKIYKISQTTVDGTVDFSENILLGVGYYAALTSKTHSPLISTFDRERFNQDIYVTYKANTGSASMNYYIELEQVKLDLGENTVATLKDIRNIGVRTLTT